MKLRNKILFLNKLAFLIFITGIILLFFTWYGLLVELGAFSLMVYLSRFRRITWWRIFSYSVFFVSIIGFLLFKYHTSKIKFLQPDWNLMPSAEKYYFDPLYSQRSMNFNFDSLMMSSDELKKVNLYTTDTQAVPDEAPIK